MSFPARLLRTIVVHRTLPILVASPIPRAFLGPGLRNPIHRLFGTTVSRRDVGTSDSTLSAALRGELKYEEESSTDSPVPPDFLKSFKEKGVWQIEEHPGRDDVVLTRQYGKEKIRVEFSIADLMNQQEEADYDEYIENESKTREDEDEEDSFAPSLPVRVNIVISKKNSPSTVAIEASAQDGAFAIVGVSYFEEGTLATDASAEADWKRRTLYLGPQYDRLEPNLQERFEDFLRERGIGEELALFIPAFAEHKEQVEYVEWLKRVKNFVEL